MTYKYEVGRGHKTGQYLKCLQCFRNFYIIKSRLLKSKTHCCSPRCASKYTARQRAEKLRKKHYPFISGLCFLCRKNIVIKNSGFDKSDRKFCSKSCKATVENKSRCWKKKSIKKLSKKARQRWKNGKYENYIKSGLCSLLARKNNLGKKSHFWKGGVTPINARIRSSAKYKFWRETVFKRDNWTCVWCGARSQKEKAIIINADHIKSFSLYPALRFAIDNGRTLCKDCHRKTDTFAKKINRKKLFF